MVALCFFLASLVPVQLMFSTEVKNDLHTKINYITMVAVLFYMTSIKFS